VNKDYHKLWGLKSKLGRHVLSLTFSVTRLVWFDSCSHLESAFRPKSCSCGRHSARSAFSPKRWSAFRPVGIQAASQR